MGGELSQEFGRSVHPIQTRGQIIPSTLLPAPSPRIQKSYINIFFGLIETLKFCNTFIPFYIYVQFLSAQHFVYSLHKYWILIESFWFCLQIHERSHTGEKGWICDECGDVFGGKQALDFHKSKHSGQYNFICSHCDRGFNSKTILYEHSLTHSGKDLFRSGRNTSPILNLWSIVKGGGDSMCTLEVGGVDIINVFSKTLCQDLSKYVY